MRKILFSLLLLLTGFSGWAQSEKFVARTYDTTFEVRNAEDNSLIGSQSWGVKVTMDKDYFADIHADSNNRRPVIITFGGKGEVAHSPYNPALDTPLLNNYGPEFAHLNEGFDYGIQLGNGKHYPVWITILQPSQNIPARFVLSLIRAIIATYQPRDGVLLGAGLSEGSWIIGTQMTYTHGVSGNTEAMSHWKCWVNLEGVGPDIQGTNPIPTLQGAVATWATTYGGRFFGLDGSSVSVADQVGPIVTPMNAAVSNSAYYSVENYGGGGHCCWNSMYDPSVINWRSIAPIVNANLVSTANNKMGNYFVDATNGSNIFQWMLRQTDTTLVGTASCNPVVSVSNQSFFLPKNSTTLTATATSQCGHTISSYTWSTISGPNSPTFGTPSAASTTVSGLIAGTYTFQIIVTDNTVLATVKQIQVVVLAEVPPTVSAGGTYTVTLPTTQVTLAGSASGNGGASVTAILWTKLSGPGTQSISNNTTLTPTIVGLQVGTSTFQIKATDGNGNFSTDVATINVTNGGPIQIVYDSVAAGEYVTGWLDHFGKGFAFTTNLPLAAANNTGIPGGAIAPSFPNGTTFKHVSVTLHGNHWVTSDGHVFATGGGDQGQGGTGDILPGNSPYAIPKMLTVDSSGRDSINNITLTRGTYTGNARQGAYFVKAGTSSDTLLFAGASGLGIRGDGTTTLDTVARPVIVWSLPTGKRIVSLVGGKYGVACLNDGTVWSCGGSFSPGTPPNYASLGYVPGNSATDYLTWHKVIFPGPIPDSIYQVVGGDVGGTLCLGSKLWGFGPFSWYLGNQTGPSYNTPTDLTDSVTKYVPGGIRYIAANSQTFHYISTRDSLYGNGDNADGSIGNNQEIDFQHWSTPYSFDPAQKFGLMVTHPVKVTNLGHWKSVHGNVNFGFTTFAIQRTDTIYGAGRNKGGVLGNGIEECIGSHGDQAAAWPNSWDVPALTRLNPKGVTAGIPVQSPGCYNGTFTLPADVAKCSVCTNPTTILVCNAGGNQNLTIGQTIAFLNGTLSTCSGGSIIKYTWSQDSGPNTAIFDVISDPLASVSGLIPGTYVLRLTVKDNAGNSATQTMTITISGQVNFLTFPKRVTL